jgi:hypothetical protein
MEDAVEDSLVYTIIGFCKFGARRLADDGANLYAAPDGEMR